MPEVLDHRLGALLRTFQPHVRVISRLLLSSILYLLAVSCVPSVAAQDVVNGQFQSQGLSVIDSPQPNSTLHAGSETDVSIDVSIASNATFGIDSLEVYLVSSDAQINLTVSSGPQLLAQEPGSTVKHIHWSVPTCLQTGGYNLTVYESSHLNDATFFAITPVPVQVQNNGDVSPDSCSGLLNTVQEQPQPSNPPPPGLLPDPEHRYSSAIPASSTISAGSTATTNANGTVSTTSPQATGSNGTSSSGGNIVTVTAGDGTITIDISKLPGTIVVEPSGGAPAESTMDSSSGFITVTKTVAPTATATLTEIESVPVTVTLEETFIVTSFAPGTTLEYTSTRTIVSTAEVEVTQVSSPQQAGLLPINAGSMVAPTSALLFLWTSFASAFMYALFSL
ncbi:hypothetical protein OH77DRAFT_1469745 [Trametes cingulata]|nr:hypothetical protein OH77DRAFT_1469745 [Trametes cingulata]